jgi:hypothetical protein
MTTKQYKELEDDDIPVCYSESIEEYEQRVGHGFYGNQTTGYSYNK